MLIKFILFSFHSLQKTLPILTNFVRNISADKTLKEILAEKIPQEQENVKAFRKSHGATKVGEITVDMVSIKLQFVCLCFFLFLAFLPHFMHKSNTIEAPCA